MKFFSVKYRFQKLVSILSLYKFTYFLEFIYMVLYAYYL